MAFYQILFWQDIPSQIKAWDDVDEVKIALPQKFAAKIDQSAQAQGLTHSDDYLAQWRWNEEREQNGSANEVAKAVQEELEKKFF